MILYYIANLILFQEYVEADIHIKETLKNFNFCPNRYAGEDKKKVEAKGELFKAHANRLAAISKLKMRDSADNFYSYLRQAYR